MNSLRSFYQAVSVKSESAATCSRKVLYLKKNKQPLIMGKTLKTFVFQPNVEYESQITVCFI